MENKKKRNLTLSIFMNIELILSMITFICFMIIVHFVIKSFGMADDGYYYLDNFSLKELKSFLKLTARAGRGLQFIGAISVLAIILRVFTISQRKRIGSGSGIAEHAIAFTTYGINFLGVLIYNPLIKILTKVKSYMKGADKLGLFEVLVDISDELSRVGEERLTLGMIVLFIGMVLSIYLFIIFLIKFFAERRYSDIKNNAAAFTEDVMRDPETGEINFSESVKQGSQKAKDSFNDFKDSQKVQDFTENIKEKSKGLGPKLKEVVEDLLDIDGYEEYEGTVDLKDEEDSE